MEFCKVVAISIVAILSINGTFSQSLHPSFQYNNNSSRYQQSSATIRTLHTENDSSKRSAALNDSARNALTFFKLEAPNMLLDDKVSLMYNILTNPNLSSGNSLKDLKQQLKNTSVDSADKLNSINSQIDVIKIHNTQEFLTHLKPPKVFWITHVNRYNIDTFNNWLYAQKDVSSLQTAAIQNFTNSNTFINAELGSFLFGPVRLGIGGTFTTTGDTTKDNAIKTSLQKILTNGGDFNANFSAPFLLLRSRNEKVHFGIFAQINNSINPGIDSTGKTDFSKGVLYTNQSGADIYFDLNSNDSKARLSFDMPFYYVWGSNNTYQQLSRKDFSVVKLQVGAVFGNLIDLHISGPLFSTSKSIQKIPFVVSIQFSPSQAIKSINKE